MENLTLGGLAQYFSDNGPHFELAGSISDMFEQMAMNTVRFA